VPHPSRSHRRECSISDKDFLTGVPEQCREGQLGLGWPCEAGASKALVCACSNICFSACCSCRARLISPGLASRKRRDERRLSSDALASTSWRIADINNSSHLASRLRLVRTKCVLGHWTLPRRNRAGVPAKPPPMLLARPDRHPIFQIYLEAD